MIFHHFMFKSKSQGVTALGQSTHLIVGSADGVKVKALVLVVQLGAAQAALVRRARHTQVPVNRV